MFRHALAVLFVWLAPLAAGDDKFWWAAKVTVETAAGTSAGSGTPVYAANGKTLVLTNAHVVRPAWAGDKITVSVQGKEYPAAWVDGSDVVELGATPTARTIRIDGPDLCVLAVDATLTVTKVARELPRPGTRVCQWGYGGSADGLPVRRMGELVGEEGADIRTAYLSVPGDSGSGVFADDVGLVGVQSRVWREGGVSLAVSLAEVRKFLTRPKVVKAFPGITEK